MEKFPETPPPQVPNPPVATLLPPKTPPRDQPADRNSPDSGNDQRKICTPDRLNVPKAFKYPERYTSPTDLMMSPVTRGLLARSRKTTTALLTPSINQPKEVGLSQI